MDLEQIAEATARQTRRGLSVQTEMAQMFQEWLDSTAGYLFRRNAPLDRTLYHFELGRC
jgi:hypothetical protein